MKEFSVIAFLLVCFAVVGHYEWEDEERVASLPAPAVTLKCVAREAHAERLVRQAAHLVARPVNRSAAQVLECRVIEERT